MGKSRHQHHKMDRSNRIPSPFVDNEGKIKKHRKMKPYGMGNSEEIDTKKWGTVKVDSIHKSAFRKKMRDYSLEEFD